MRLLEWFKRREKDMLLEELRQSEDHPGMVFMVHLLMKEKCKMPSKERMVSIMEKHLGEVNCLYNDNKMAGFAPQRYKNLFPEAVPPQLIVMECSKTDDLHVDEIARSQMWDCENSEEILEECGYQVIAMDLMGGATGNYKRRADMLMDFLEALVEMYPECVAVLFETSKKMFTREAIFNHQIPRQDRFVYFGVNVRLFHIEGTEDMVVDTLGMRILYLPDLQYRFHGMDAEWVMNHAYNLLAYLYENNAPIRNGEKVDGMVNGHISREVQWKCRYRDALIQPSRNVLDVNIKGYASRERKNKKEKDFSSIV